MALQDRLNQLRDIVKHSMPKLESELSGMGIIGLVMGGYFAITKSLGYSPSPEEFAGMTLVSKAVGDLVIGFRNNGLNYVLTNHFKGDFLVELCILALWFYVLPTRELVDKVSTSLNDMPSIMQPIVAWGFGATASLFGELIRRPGLPLIKGTFMFASYVTEGIANLAGYIDKHTN